MSNPAVDAARRAWEAGPAADIEFRPGEDGVWTPAAMVAAAREVLAPLRAKHQRVRRLDGSFRCTSCRDAYGGHADWPTGTDRLIWPSEES
ncbi:hypothetical protein SEA_VANLEE_73 [Gordonia phage VanLee]|uniref:Uncharacterized protein n=1 Tax=Gordonia phage VanLee TaxID=2845816 RepID=A0A8F2D9F3_9CAUD|nr:hypothetical protein QEH49_gp073 [Gordonia phage VanLee]QWS68190.1 hypothetical protein SEA_VANLEE_73 [Gordonia phage VanLee]